MCKGSILKCSWQDINFIVQCVVFEPKQIVGLAFPNKCFYYFQRTFDGQSGSGYCAT